MRFRNVECKIFMEFSKTVATLPDKVNIIDNLILLTADITRSVLE